MRLAPILQAFFTDYLMTQRHASPHTIASYRDCLRLLLTFARQRTGKLPAQLDLADLDAVLVGTFLTELESTRGNSAATRNTRLTAIHSLFRYASLQAPEHAGLISRVLAIPAKRTRTDIVSFLTQAEVDALIGAVDHHLARTPRPDPAEAGRPDRAARLRTDRPDHRRCPPGHRPARVLPRQEPPITVHSADPRPPSRRSLPGWANAAAAPTIPCSPPAPETRCLATRSPTCWPSMSRRQHPAARAWTARR